jgi:glutamine synthetase
MNIVEFRALAEAKEIHTVEIAHPDQLGHLRGKRVPVDRFLRAWQRGVNIADAIFVFDVSCDLVDNEWINSDSGFGDMTLLPDLATTRILTHRPGYAMVFADAKELNGDPQPMSPRTVLAEQIARCEAAGLSPMVATEMENFLCLPDWTPAQTYIQYSSLTDGVELEFCIADMREALMGAGMDVESSNTEYAGGQIEINVTYGEAMRVADDTVLLKSIIKQVAREHGLRATYMPKPWTEEGGSGMHIHTSLNTVGGTNAFADSLEDPNELMRGWLGGLIEHAVSMSLLTSGPTVNGYKRIRPYTFAPTHVTWGGDNRSVLARCIMEADSPANRVEFRSSGADANPYLAIAAVLAAGVDGLERKLDPGTKSEGDKYGTPGDATPLPITLAEAIDAYEGSGLAALLGEKFSTTYLNLARHELGLYTDAVGEEGDEVSDFERDRYIEHT